MTLYSFYVTRKIIRNKIVCYVIAIQHEKYSVIEVLPLLHVAVIFINIFPLQLNVTMGKITTRKIIKTICSFSVT